jgi:hypothetical protein
MPAPLVGYDDAEQQRFRVAPVESLVIFVDQDSEQAIYLAPVLAPGAQAVQGAWPYPRVPANLP